MSIPETIRKTLSNLILSNKSLLFMTSSIVLDERCIEKLLGDEFFLSRILQHRNVENAFLSVVDDDRVLDSVVFRNTI